jgi:small subunit ribosomal protein S14
MARKALIIKAEKTPKFKTRGYKRCMVCGRSRSNLNIYGGVLCRIHLRQYIYQGILPGFRKYSH